MLQNKKIFLSCIVIFIISYGKASSSTDLEYYKEEMSIHTLFNEESCKKVLNPKWSGAETYFWRKLCNTDDIDFNTRTLRRRHIDPESKNWPDTRLITGAFIEEILTKVEYRPYVDNRTIFISNIWLNGYVYLRNIELTTSLIFIGSKINSTINIYRSKFSQLRFNSSVMLNRLEINKSSLDDGLYTSGSTIKDGIDIKQSSIVTLSIDKSTLFNSSARSSIHYDPTGKIIRGDVAEKPSFSVENSTIGFWGINNSFMEDVRIDNVVFNQINLVGISKTPKSSEEKGKRKMSLNTLNVKGNFSMQEIDAFSDMEFINLSIEHYLVLATSKLSKLDIGLLQSGSLAIMDSEIETLNLFSSKINGNFLYSWNSEDILKQAGIDNIVLEEKQDSSKNADYINQILYVVHSKFGSMSLNDSRLREITISGVDITNDVSFYSGQPKYEMVTLFGTKFGSLFSRWPEDVEHDLEFLGIANYTKENYIQFSEAYRIVGLDTEADKIMIEAYNRESENLTKTRKAFYILWHYLTGYGYKLEYALWWSIGIVTFGSCVAYWFTRKKLKKNRLFIWYSLDMFLPVIRLSNRHDKVTFASSFARNYFLFHKIIGFIVMSYLIAGIVSF